MQHPLIKYYEGSLPATGKNGKTTINKSTYLNMFKGSPVNRKRVSKSFYENPTSSFSKCVFPNQHHNLILDMRHEINNDYAHVRLLKGGRFISSIIYHCYENK